MMNYEVINASVDDIFSLQTNGACNNEGCVINVGCVNPGCVNPVNVGCSSNPNSTCAPGIGVGCPIPLSVNQA